MSSIRNRARAWYIIRVRIPIGAIRLAVATMREEIQPHDTETTR